MKILIILITRNLPFLIYNLKPNSYIFINDHQKSINRIINGANITYKIGLRDGYYKVLNNIKIYKNINYKK